MQPESHIRVGRILKASRRLIESLRLPAVSTVWARTTRSSCRFLVDRTGRVAQPLGLNLRVPDPSRLFEGSEGLDFPPVVLISVRGTNANVEIVGPALPI